MCGASSTWAGETSQTPTMTLGKRSQTSVLLCGGIGDLLQGCGSEFDKFDPLWASVWKCDASQTNRFQDIWNSPIENTQVYENYTLFLMITSYLEGVYCS